MQETKNPSPAEGKLDSAMKEQHTDSLVTDGVKDTVQHNDPTGSTPKGNSVQVGTEKPIFEGTLHEKMIGGKAGVKQDFTKG